VDTETDELVEEGFDMVVLSVGLLPPEGSEVLDKALGLPRQEDGFFATVQPEVSSVLTPVDGIIIAGAVEGPKDIPDSIAQASAAAMKAAVVMAESEPGGGA